MWHQKEFRIWASFHKNSRSAFRSLRQGFEQLDARRCFALDLAIDQPMDDLSIVELSQEIQLLNLEDISPLLGYEDGLDPLVLEPLDESELPLDEGSGNELLPSGPLENSSGGFGSSEFGGSVTDNNSSSPPENVLSIEYWQSLAAIFGNYSNAGRLAGEHLLSNQNYSRPAANAVNLAVQLAQPTAKPINSSPSIAVNPSIPQNSLANDRAGQIAPVPVLVLPKVEVASASVRTQLHDISSIVSSRALVVSTRESTVPSLAQAPKEHASSVAQLHFRTRDSAPSLLERQPLDFRQARTDSRSEVVSNASLKMNTASARVLTIDQRHGQASTIDQARPVRRALLPTFNKPLHLRPATTHSQVHANDNIPKLQKPQPIDSAAIYRTAPQGPSPISAKILAQPARSADPQRAFGSHGLHADEIESAQAPRHINVFASLAWFAPWIVIAIKKRRNSSSLSSGDTSADKIA